MAKPDKETIHTLARLSRIHCTDEAEEALVEDLTSILTYVEQLAEVETESVQPCNHVLATMQNVMREDEVKEPMPRQTLLENAPDQIGGMIRVPQVIKGKQRA